MFDTSCPSRDDPCLKEYSMMFPNKLNPQEFLLCANEEILICPCVLEYATLAINLSLLQHTVMMFEMTQSSQPRHARPKRTEFLREKQTHIHQSPLNPPDRATTISHLITQSIVHSRERC